MPLTCVTITGADDLTDVGDLAILSHEFPFVEWGILIGSNEDVERFPSRMWIQQLIKAREGMNNEMRLSLHVCGLVQIVEVDADRVQAEVITELRRRGWRTINKGWRCADCVCQRAANPFGG